MCVVCAEMRPWAAGCDYAALVPPGSGGDRPADGEPASLDRFADQLLTGYWGIDAPRGFAPGPERLLHYDAGALSPEGRAVARAALDEWSLVSGLVFRDAVEGVPSTPRRERGDADASPATAERLRIGEAFEGGIDRAGDRDWIRLDLDPAETVEVAITGLAAGGLGAPLAVLRDEAGARVPVAWRTKGGTTEAVIAAAGEGTGPYYLELSGRSGALGGYRIELREPGARVEADIVFRDDRSGAQTSIDSLGSVLASAEVNVEASWLDDYGDAPGTYGFQAYLHEIGHVLGLGHAGDYDLSGAYERDALFANDSWQASVMSYFDQSENPIVAADHAYVATPMAADLVAVRRLYGEVPVREGDTTYGEGSTAGGTLDLVADHPDAMAFTLLDTGGHDRLMLASQSGDQRVDLRPEAASDVFGHRGNMVVARGTIIEDVVLGVGDDRVTGNAAANRLEGRGGADMLLGGGGADVLMGGHGPDILKGGTGADALHGGPGADRLDGGPGPDRLAGGGDADRLTGGSGGDRLYGNRGADVLDGGPGDDALAGGPGDDLLRGGGGADVFVFAGVFGRDRIADFAAGTPGERIDLVRLAEPLSFGDLDLRERDDGILLDLGEAGRIHLSGLRLPDLHADDFLL